MTYAADDIQPAPTSEVMRPIESLVHCRLKIAAESAAEGCSHVEQSNSFRELSLRVPTS